jgi:DNA-binding NarL/FixJ family response regulator
LTILVADHSKDWRRAIRLLLEKDAELRDVIEAADGLEAIHKAEELQPDLILLDVGLPKLNGIKAASRVSVVAPRSKLLFLSVHDDDSVVQAAFTVGALGYIHKFDSATELLNGARAVASGNHFVSSRITCHCVS